MLDSVFLSILSIPIYIVILAIFIIKKVKILDIFFYSLFYFYIVVLIAVTLFPIPIQWLEELGKYGWKNNNFIPLHSIFEILLDKNLYYTIKIKQILWNILLFLPLWFFISLLCKNINFKKVFFISFLFSIFIESLQFIIWLVLWFNYRSFDIDDILLNIFWWIIGFVLYKIFVLIFRKNK